MAERRRRARQGGQASVEYAIVTAGVVIPLTFGLIYMAQLLWIWHSVSDFSRDGARYAATHCWQGSGANVQDYLRTHVPAMIDQDQFRDGGADIEVVFFQRNADSGALEDFTCEGAECSRECVPDVVSVRVNNYQFTKLFSYFGLQPVTLPNFSTTLPMESAGCSPDSDSCLP